VRLPGGRFTPGGFIRIFQRLSKQTGIHVTTHASSRNFVILSLRNGMVQHYAQMIVEDLLAEHKAHFPIDNL
jgi:hypothetical protein